MVSFSFLTRLLRLYARLDRGVDRGQQIAKTVVGQLLARALKDGELDELTAALYEEAGPVNERGLFDWEAEWFAQSLPGPPASVLLGGAGYGREAVALQNRGYRIFAFDPQESAVRTCAERLDSIERVWCAGYEDLPTGLEGKGPLGSLHAKRFDAVVFGWGSFGHLRHASSRKQAIECAHALTSGPILLSYLELPREEGEASMIAATVGDWFARIRRVSDRERQHYSFRPWCGFVARVRRSEIEETAQRLSRRVEWGPPGSYPRATLSLP